MVRSIFFLLRTILKFAAQHFFFVAQHFGISCASFFFCCAPFFIEVRGQPGPRPFYSFLSRFLDVLTGQQ
jgi:hypothetical protein